jgi:hypothetical protein
VNHPAESIQQNDMVLNFKAEAIRKKYKVKDYSYYLSGGSKSTHAEYTYIYIYIYIVHG